MSNRVLNLKTINKSNMSGRLLVVNWASDCTADCCQEGPLTSQRYRSAVDAGLRHTRRRPPASRTGGRGPHRGAPALTTSSRIHRSTLHLQHTTQTHPYAHLHNAQIPKHTRTAPKGHL